MCRVGRGKSRRGWYKEKVEEKEEGLVSPIRSGIIRSRNEAFIIRDDSSMRVYADRVRAIIGPVLTPLSPSWHYLVL